ncbi:MAG: hypothetical protein HYZ16_08750 [Bacteroidetes bacterium]|jgi:hypothetical protein|nr:hypothetical protein [Bacteroidota bacterium]
MKHIDTTTWSVADFQAFVLLYLARIDGQPIDEEMEVIMAKVGSDTARSMRRQTDALSDYECIKVIGEERKRFYPDDKGAQDLMQELISLLMMDGKLTDFESTLLHRLTSLW